MFNMIKFLRDHGIGLFGARRDVDELTNYSIDKDIPKHEEFMEEFQYKTGLVFYMDILGCRQLSLKSGVDEISLTKVRKIVEIFREIEKQYEDKHWGRYYKMPFTHEGHTVDRPLGESNIEVTMSLFSDGIIISYYPEATDRFVIWYKQMHQIFNDICRTIFIFARNGFFLRGGMSYGKFYHSGSICYGPALLEAVRLEDEICYPTIAIGDSFRKKIQEDLGSKEIDDYAPGYKYPYELKTFAEDFFSIFLDSTIVNGKSKLMLDWLLSVFYYDLDRIDPIKNAITEELNTNYPDKVKEKYIWLAKRFNHSLHGVRSLGLGDYLHAEIQIKG
jgi:hypothetical protein